MILRVAPAYVYDRTLAKANVERPRQHDDVINARVILRIAFSVRRKLDPESVRTRPCIEPSSSAN